MPADIDKPTQPTQPTQPSDPVPSQDPVGLLGLLINNKAATAGLGVLGVFGAAFAGYITITTPEEQQCQIDLADTSARLELLTEAKEACKDVLESLMKESP